MAINAVQNKSLVALHTFSVIDFIAVISIDTMDCSNYVLEALKIHIN
jgi:hypothetical protein